MQSVLLKQIVWVCVVVNKQVVDVYVGVCMIEIIMNMVYKCIILPGTNQNMPQEQIKIPN